MFSIDYNFRYSDIDKDGRIKISTVLDLLQDVSIAHADFAGGLGSERLSKEKVAFLLDGWRVRFDKPFDKSKVVTVKTGIMRVRKCETVRKYEIWQNGECKVIGTAVWYSVNTEKRAIARLEEKFYLGFDNIAEEDNGFEYVSIRPEKTAEFCAVARVARRDIDTNHHMNNVKSVEFMLDFLPDGFEISQLQVKYRKELREAEEVKIYGRQTDDGYHLEIKNAEDKTCVIVKAIY